MQNTDQSGGLVPSFTTIPPTDKNEPSLSIEELIKTAKGLSYVHRITQVSVDGKHEIYWQAVGSWGRSGVVTNGVTIQEAIQKLTSQPYHIDPALGRNPNIPTEASDEDLFVRALALGKSPSELLEEANISNIKYNWEEKQALPLTCSWTVSGGNGKNSQSYHANSLHDALAKAWVFGILGVKKLGEDAEHIYLADYMPGLGTKTTVQDHFGYSGLETIVRKTDIFALLEGGIDKMFQ